LPHQIKILKTKFPGRSRQRIDEEDNGPPDAILAVQRAAGNRATSELLRCALKSHANPIGSQKYNARRAHTSAGNVARRSDLPPIVQEAIRSSGQPLEAQTRAFMQSRFGNNFAHVRLHTGDKAAASASSVGASAYTLGVTSSSDLENMRHIQRAGDD
jgi:Domain of unknown function (DUF4157)